MATHMVRCATVVGNCPAAGVGESSLPDLSRGGLQRPSRLDLVVVQDDSASVCGADGACMRLEAGRLAVSLLRPGARIAFVAFGGADRGRAIPLRWIRREADRSAILAAMEEATFEKGGTDYVDALRSVIDVLRDGDAAYGWPPYRAGRRTVGVLFLSDGQPGVDSRREPDQQQLDALRGRGGVYELLRARGWPVFTVGLGGAMDDPEAATILGEMAAATGGEFRLASSPDELLAACTAVMAELGRRETSAEDRGAG